MDWIFPLIAIILVFTTAKGRYRTINLVLTMLLSAHYGYEVYIVEGGFYDSIQHDIFMLGIYSLAAYTFYRLCGDIQAILACVGVGMSIAYGTAWYFVAYPHDFMYREAMVFLTVLQLLAASRGALWTIFNKLTHGVNHGRGMVRHTYHGVDRRSVHRGGS